MALTAHKTVTMFMRYVHTEDDPVRAAADAVALRRQTLIGDIVAVPAPEPAHEPPLVPPSIAPEPADDNFVILSIHHPLAGLEKRSHPRPLSGTGKIDPTSHLH
jgi:hypothetical protein